MRLICDNRPLIQDQPKTVTTATIAAAGTTLTVKNNNGFAQYDYVLIGKLGEEKTEIKLISAAVVPATTGTSLTIAAVIFAHDEDTPVTKVDYDQVRFYHGSTNVFASSTALAAAFALDPSEIFTYYEDTAYTTGYGFVRYYDSRAPGAYSTASDAIPYTGYTAKMKRSIRNKVRRLINETDEMNSPLSNDDINDEINMAQKEIAHDRLWSFYEKTKSFSSVLNQYEYSLASDVFTVFDSTFETQPLAIIGVNRWNNLRWDTETTGDPTHICIWRDKARVYPYPDGSADTAAISGAAHTASSTTITVDSTSDFPEQGRAYVTDGTSTEVFSYTGTTTTTFTGCTRGEEGTTAYALGAADVVTERDFIYHFQEEPADMTDETDETRITEPSVLSYKAGAECALRLDKEILHDRLLAKYDKAMVQLRKVDEPKIRMTFPNVREHTDVVTDKGIWKDPNEYPSGLS